MKCDWVRTNLPLYIYDELLDDARYELEQHIARCAQCAVELKQTQSFQSTMSAAAVTEPSPNLLAASRMSLQEGLETAERPGFWHRFTFDFASWFRHTRFSPALASAIFILGVAAGIGSTYKIISGSHQVAVSGLLSRRSKVPLAELAPSASNQAATRLISNTTQ